MPGPTTDAVNKRTHEVYAAQGFVKTDKRTGHEVKDDGAVKNKVFEILKNDHVVNVESDVIDDGLSAQDLYATVFPGSPGAKGVPPNDEVDLEVWTKLRRKVWAFASPEITGFCQGSAELAGLDFVLVQKEVWRPTRDEVTGTLEPKKVWVRFFTSDPDMVFEYSSLPATAKLVKVAEATAKHLEMNRKRRPELGARLAKEARAALTKSSAELTAITSGSTAKTERSPAASAADES